MQSHAEAERARIALFEACVRWSNDFAREHKITVQERDSMPAGTAAFANWQTRTVVVRPFSPALSARVLMERLESRKHEFGHVLRGRCPGTAPHYRDPAVTDWHNCVQCEVDAWDTALTLDGPASRAIQRHIKQALLTYLLITPAHRGALEAARRVWSDGHFATSMQARAARERRRQMIADGEEAAADVARRPLTRLERQRRDIERWSLEARG